MISVWIDVAIIGVVAFCAWRGYKNGLIRGVFGIVSLIAALLVANVIAQAYSKEATSVIMPFASGIIDSTLTDIEEEGITYQPIAYDHDLTGLNIEAFGDSYIVMRQIGLPEAAAVAIAKQIAENPETFERPQQFIETLAEKLTDTMSYIAVFGIAFLLLAIIFAVIGNLFGFVFSLPGLKLLDIISGSVFGLVKGIIIVLTLAVIFRYFGLIARDTVESTLLLNYLMNNNIIANILDL